MYNMFGILFLQMPAWLVLDPVSTVKYSHRLTVLFYSVVVFITLENSTICSLIIVVGPLVTTIYFLISILFFKLIGQLVTPTDGLVKSHHWYWSWIGCLCLISLIHHLISILLSSIEECSRLILAAAGLNRSRLQ